MDRRVRAFAAAAVVTAILTSAAGALAASDKFKPFKLRAVDGRQVALTDVLGRATLVVFFFPTCPYCNAALPHLQRIYDAHKDAGLAMVLINVVPAEDRLVAGWQAAHSYTAPVLLSSRSIADDYRVTMTPTHYLLSADGRILNAHAGYTPGDEKLIDREVVAALKEEP
jgi:cytochrome oxidase Cu insertion factor (SCO1/SenC/PrrC family)